MANSSSSGPAGGGGGFDQIAIPNGAGGLKYMTRAEYEALPLGDRVRLLMGGTLQFFRNGKPVPAREALRGT